MPAKNTTRREPWNPLLKGYPFSEKVNAVSVGAETLFTRLVAQADDFGNYYGNPKQILAYLYGHRFAAGHVTATDTGRWRAELVSNAAGPLAAIYEVNGAEYIHLLNPRRRIRSDVAPDERFPREPANIQEQATTEHVTRTGRKRTVNGSLDLDQDLDLDQKEHSSKTPEKTYSSAKGKILKSKVLERFEAFLTEFGDKRGKADAADSWFKLKPMPDELYTEIIAGAKRYSMYRASLKNGTTPKMAQGWLTSRRWEDKTEISNPTISKRDVSDYENAFKKETP